MRMPKLTESVDCRPYNVFCENLRNRQVSKLQLVKINLKKGFTEINERYCHPEKAFACHTKLLTNRSLRNNFFKVLIASQ